MSKGMNKFQKKVCVLTLKSKQIMNYKKFWKKKTNKIKVLMHYVNKMMSTMTVDLINRKLKNMYQPML